MPDNLAVQGRSGKARTSSPVKDGRTENRDAHAGVLRHGVLRVRMWDGVMKFVYAWTFAGNASAAARKTGPGIAAPAGVPCPVPPKTHTAAGAGQWP